jgi:hypothetical protein
MRLSTQNGQYITIAIIKLKKNTLLNNKKYITIKIHNNNNTYKMIKNVTKRTLNNVIKEIDFKQRTSHDLGVL